MTKVTHLTADEHGGLNRRRIHLREISGDADTPLETVGQDLRAARTRRGDDLATVSRSLKIRKDHLEAIEEDRLEALPGRTYAVGFVRSYADYLGLDPVQAVERFKGEIAGRSDGSHPIALAPETEERQLPHGWVIIAVVVLVILAYGAYHLAKSADSLLKGPVAPVPARIVPQPPVGSLNRTVSPAQPVSSPASSPPTSSPAAQTSASPQAPPTAGAQGGPTTGAPVPQTNGQPPPVPAGEEFGRQNRDARVILRAKSVTRVLVQGADGTVFINRVLRPGDSYRVPDKVGLTLTAPDGGDVGIELDGQEMGTAGSNGQVTEALSLDPQSIFDRAGRSEPR